MGGALAKGLVEVVLMTGAGTEDGDGAGTGAIAAGLKLAGGARSVDVKPRGGGDGAVAALLWGGGGARAVSSVGVS